MTDENTVAAAPKSQHDQLERIDLLELHNAHLVVERAATLVNQWQLEHAKSVELLKATEKDIAARYALSPDDKVSMPDGTIKRAK